MEARDHSFAPELYRGKHVPKQKILSKKDKAKAENTKFSEWEPDLLCFFYHTVSGMWTIISFMMKEKWHCMVQLIGRWVFFVISEEKHALSRRDKEDDSWGDFFPKEDFFTNM